MNPNLNPSSGPLQAAIARRAGALNQQGAGSATPSVLPSQPPQGNPQMVPQTPQGGQSSERVDDAHIILKAMAGRLKSQEKIAEAQSIPLREPDEVTQTYKPGL